MSPRIIKTKVAVRRFIDVGEFEIMGELEIPLFYSGQPVASDTSGLIRNPAHDLLIWIENGGSTEQRIGPPLPHGVYLLGDSDRAPAFRYPAHRGTVGTIQLLVGDKPAEWADVGPDLTGDCTCTKTRRDLSCPVGKQRGNHEPGASLDDTLPEFVP